VIGDGVGVDCMRALGTSHVDDMTTRPSDHTS
jgi:hypothetical protein